MSSQPCARPGCGHPAEADETKAHPKGHDGRGCREVSRGTEMAITPSACPCPGYHTPEQQEAWAQARRWLDAKLTRAGRDSDTGHSEYIVDRLLELYP